MKIIGIKNWFDKTPCARIGLYRWHEEFTAVEFE